MLTETNIELSWNFLQEPVRRAGNPADYLLLLSALDDGWKIMDAVFVDHNISKSYSLTLFHPRRALLQQMTVAPGPQADALLKNEVTTTINRYEQPLL
jgi:hypothetical protein